MTVTQVSNGLETNTSAIGGHTACRCHTHSIGRLIQGSIDLVCGHLMLECEDFAWGGSRMGVALQHLYTSAPTGNAADFSAMGLGSGWRLNVMQSMIPGTDDQYIFTDENGAETVFRLNEGSYEDGDGAVYDPETRVMTRVGEAYAFDTAGRLTSVSDGYGNTQNISYTDGRIIQVTDGAGRVFAFSYTEEGFLSSVTAPDGTAVRYTYAGRLLTGITWPGGAAAQILYDEGSRPSMIQYAGQRLQYAYADGCVCEVVEMSDGDEPEIMHRSVYDYSVAGRTAVTSYEDTDDGTVSITTVYARDSDGNVLSEYVYAQDVAPTGASGSGSGVHPYCGNGGVSTVSMTDNLLLDHGFHSLNAWVNMPGNAEGFNSQLYMVGSGVQHGWRCLHMKSNDETAAANGRCQSVSLEAGEYTLSGYLKPTGDMTGGVYLRVADAQGNTLAQTELLSDGTDHHIRLVTHFILSQAQTVSVQVLMDGAGEAFADALQLERNPYASAYNMLHNNSFDTDEAAWSFTDGAAIDSTVCFNRGRSLKITGDPDSQRNACQSIQPLMWGNTRETFTLSGWAKAAILPDQQGTEPSTFRLRAELMMGSMTDPTVETFTADFCPGTQEWQYVSVQFAKTQNLPVLSGKICCDFDYSSGEAWFDNIQLVRDSLETGLTAEDFPAETDCSGEETAEPLEAEEEASVFDFEELTDSFGNDRTETTFFGDEFGTVYRSFDYGENGNDLLRETDARGGQTLYTVDAATSRVTQTQDRCGNKTACTYDAAGRTAKVISKDAADTALAEVSYAYDDFDNMTAITRGDGVTYGLAYNKFHKLESIGIEGKAEKLVTYGYGGGSGRLKTVTYANGHKMTLAYNSLGQLVSEQWHDADEVLVAHYRYVHDNRGNLTRSIDFLGKREYTYIYHEDKIARAVEYTLTLDENGSITARTLQCEQRYTYGQDGDSSRKEIRFPDGTVQTVHTESTENGNPMTHCAIGNTAFSSHSKTDAFGRKEFEELRLGKAFMSRQFTYHVGQVSAEHQESSKVVSTPVTQLVDQIRFSDGRTIAYEYDAEERITKVTDSVDGITEYTYDAMGQLLTEKVNGMVINTMTYDGYGNILTKNGVQYTYDSVWKDRLIGYGDKTVTYDAQGNPTRYLGSAMTWEKGRQLKSPGMMKGYTYNANGVRTFKSVGGYPTAFTVEGTKILRAKMGYGQWIPVYDNEDSVCGIIYNDVPYYFQKNLQGDIIGIVDENGTMVARYRYDAWGACTIVADTSGQNIAENNPYRYRSYFFDSETGFYYLQSRYYDPTTGRFINGDQAVISVVVGAKSGHNSFAYCCNDPIGRADLMGYASYSTILKKSGSKWNIKTTLYDSKKTFLYSYTINGGRIRFDFSVNNYRTVVDRRIASTLARAMYYAAKAINKNYLKGRTIAGIHAELFLHWALYSIGIMTERSNPADIGSINGTGNDDNAWVFETISTINLVMLMNAAKKTVSVHLGFVEIMQIPLITQ